MPYFVLGIECMNTAEVRATISNKKIAIELANHLEKNKSHLCCQRYEVMTVTEAKKRYELYSYGGLVM